MIDFDVLCRADQQELWQKATRKANIWHLGAAWFYIKDVKIDEGSSIFVFAFKSEISFEKTT